jgi:hypothetical protein
MISTSHQLSFLCDKIKTNEVGGACGMCLRQEIYIQGFGGET